MATTHDDHDDPARLSAFMDGELDDRRRSAVADELRDSPSLRAEHESLQALTHLLAELPRPTPPRDLALDAVREIERRGLKAPRPLALKPTGRAPWMVLGTLSAVAAGLLLAWLSQNLDFRITLKNNRPPTFARSGVPHPKNIAPDSVLSPDSLIAHSDSDSSLDPPDTDNPPLTAASDSQIPAPSPNEPLELPNFHSAQLAQLLESGDPRRLVISVDHLDQFALLRIENAIDESPRVVARHARLLLEPGLTIDPSLPGEAVVYVLTLRDPEIEALRQRLNRLFPEQLGLESSIETAILTRLAQLGDPITIQESIPRSIVSATPLDSPQRGRRESSDSAPIVGFRHENSSPIRDPVNLPTLPPRTPGDPLSNAQIGTAPAPRSPAPAVAEPVESSVHTYLLWLIKKPAS